ncbi:MULTISPECIES: FAD-dependent oxidoreductase [unclassified Nocardioides]|uniref:FAD-dependent oxidoreductase n=1 Tax=unclassified Nocardioides TaxID=2615069 RepID=UPI0009F09615|nr:MULTISPECIES: FAD-dependent oxidoreductase [unclassified Nocardioides]GAW47938.1 ferredoxin--NADP reductase [Nocardioides sp. PD653-B2]GAW53759.1 ferredoxin--NADP reductase [Nocardioides sp. PD653]
MRDHRVAIVGAGPAGIYAADTLTNEHDSARVDLIERLPAPFGLVRYGVAPDHPRIKDIVKALDRVLGKDRIRFLGNVQYGVDLKLDDLRRHYDAVVFATGAMADRQLAIPGIRLPGSHGAAEFVSWYTGHPDVPRDWPLDAREVAVIGAGNVALDVARMLVKPVEEQLGTEIPANVYAGLRANLATDVHIFARRGPAQVRFAPMELRELSHSPSVDVIVHPEGFEVDAAGQSAISSNKGTRLVVDTLLRYLESEPTGAPHRVHIHLCQSPVRVLGNHRVEGLRTQRTELRGDGTVRGTGQYLDTPVQAVYRAVGYLSSHLPDLPFDHHAGVLLNDRGRVLDIDGSLLPGLYVTGWIKRGPAGLIGHTKSDAAETTASLLDDLDALRPRDVLDPDAILDHLAAGGVTVINADNWSRIDAHEIALGRERGRERTKLVPREDMIRAALL